MTAIETRTARDLPLRNAGARHASHSDRPRAKQLLLFAAALLLTLLGWGLDACDLMAPAIVALMLATLILSFLCEPTNLFQICMVGAHYTFVVAPALILLLSGVDVPARPMAMCVLGLGFAVLLTARAHDRRRGNIASLPSDLLLAILAGSTTLMFVTSGELALYSTVAVIVAFAMSIDRKPITTSLIAYALVMSHLALYALFFWSGTGRLIVFGYALAATLVLIRNHPGIPIGKWTIFLLMAAGSALGSVFRFGASSPNGVVDAMMRDSNTSPLLLLSDIYAASSTYAVDFAGWFDQLTLLFLIGVPRTLWPDKPYGFGYQYTVDNLPQNLADSAHSVATTFVGEHVYYLGPMLGIAGLLLAVGLVASLYRLLSHPSILGGNGAIAVAVWAPTFYWGGMASFSARFSLSATPLILLYLLHQAYLVGGARKARVTDG